MRLQPCLALLLCAAAGVSTARAADVGVSIQFSEPGVYGRVDVGGYPQPPVILPAPVIAEPPLVAPPAPQEPIYLWVPPEHQAHWKEHCHRYHACGHPVYFVDHDWYRQMVMEQRHGEERHGEARGHGREEHERGDHERERERDRERD